VPPAKPATPPARPAPPAPKAAPEEDDLGFGLAPADDATADLKRKLIEQALGMEDELDDVNEPAPADHKAKLPPPSQRSAAPPPKPTAPPPQQAKPPTPAAPPPKPAPPAAQAPPPKPAAPAAPPAPGGIDLAALPLVDEPGAAAAGAGGPAGASGGDVQGHFSPEEVAVMEPMDCIATYLRLMAESRLEDASRFVGKMKKPQRQLVAPVLEKLQPDAISHPALVNVPPPVLKMFMTQMQRELR